MARTHVFFSDVHCAPSRSNSHAIALGNFLRELKPDVVVCGGDLWDFGSLCSYEESKLDFNARDYMDDVEAGIDFNEKWFSILKRQKKSMPHRVFLIGNHEQRIERLVEKNPILRSTVGYHNLNLDRYYNTIVGYDGSMPGAITIDGITYAHYFVSGASLRPISSVHLASSMISKLGVSCVMGHTHVLDFARHSFIDGRTVQAVSAGYFCNYDLDYAGYVNNNWWKGFVVLHNVDGRGGFDPEFVSLDRVMKEYY